MKKIALCTLAVVTSLFFTSVNAALPYNLTCAKRAVIEYYTSGNYEKDVDVVVQDAEKYLFKRINENKKIPQKKMAIILDIDDTSLSNFPGNKKYDFSGLSQIIDKQYREENAVAIKPVLRLYNEAVRNGVVVFFITFRPDDVRSYTISNLQKEGYFGWKNLYMPRGDEIKLGAQTYKTDIRKMLTQEGYDIILSLGDQDSDLAGGYAEHTDKIPNPLYNTSPKCDTPVCQTAAEKTAAN